MTSEDALRLRAVLETATDGIITIDEYGIVETFNTAAAQLFGYQANEVIGNNVNMLMPDPHLTWHDHYLSRYLQSRQPKIIGIGREVMGRRKDGSEFPMRLAVSEVALKDRQIFTGIIYDLTVQKKMQQQWKTLNEALEAKVKERTDELANTVAQLMDTNRKLKQEIEERINMERTLRNTEAELRQALEKERVLGELKSRFVSTASHEFRTPLSTILSATELIELYNKEEQQSKRVRNINRIKASVTTLTNTLNDFLSLSKLEEGRVKPQAAEFELQSFCNKLEGEMQNLLKPGQQIIHQHPHADLVLNLDQQILKNIFSNLISNASKYSASEATIHCETTVVGNHLKIRITDEGMGIPQEDQPFLFERFFRGHNVENIPGTGLGLNIVKAYIDILGGEISFESELGKGTSFEVMLEIES